MASSYVLLGNLRAGRCSNTAEVRLLRFWEARNVRKNGELMGVDLLLLDEQSTLIHGSINSSRVDTFRRRLNEGSVYSLSGFDVGRSNSKFSLSDSPVSIRFGDGTSFEANPDSEKDIPTEFFGFRNQEQLLTLANTNKELPDVVGELIAIRSTITDGLHGPQKFVFVHSQATWTTISLHKLPDHHAGRLFLNGTSRTHMYFESYTASCQEFLETLIEDDTYESASS